MFVNDKKYIFDANFSKEAMDKFVDTVMKLWFSSFLGEYNHIKK
jgi:hypothetical protein